ncbi:flagellar hook-basal body complex protein [Clostridium boliviensis]|uniref:Flagellar hook protein FlgE n=1 Tax=Clostridium boliviensis TaxID=318465 RepID=A0ABU4GM91_9CLOT|nr:flagellar hook-basal body complex protein [Clostridium boliviensis]MDW2798142.1 flagellar hook-basal body complex protein [Clostridium boliviensis]
MVRSMFAGVAGLRAHQAKMDVIGNNIANVNTWGYKAGSMSFKDAMYQNTSSGSGGNTEAGGVGAVNANQVGYGVTTGAITYDFSKGSMAPSASGLDCMIDGTGFFIVGPMLDSPLSLSGEDAVKSSGLYLSRVGKFKVDPNGYLTDDSGNYVYGFSYNQDDDTYDTATLTPLKLPSKADLASAASKQNGENVAKALKALNDAKNAYNTQNSAYVAAKDAYIAAQKDYDYISTTAGIDTQKTIVTDKKKVMDDFYAAWQSDLTNVTKREDYYTASNEYEEANYKLIRLQAQLQAPKALASYTSPDPETELTKYYTDYLNDLTTLRNTDKVTNPGGYETAKNNLDATKATWQNAQNKLSELEDDSPLSIRDAAKISVDTQKAKLSAASVAVDKAQASLDAAQKTASNSEKDNSKSDDSLGEFSGYTIQQDGTIVGISADGIKMVIGKIALGSVPNLGGLEKDSGYYYTPGASAGNVSVYEAGGTEGRIMGNYLEMAKVDLATEMTDMITTQRGFQANSKIITVTDQMLEELVNMKR